MKDINKITGPCLTLETLNQIERELTSHTTNLENYSQAYYLSLDRFSKMNEAHKDSNPKAMRDAALQLLIISIRILQDLPKA